jgi:hypothetical protein
MGAMAVDADNDGDLDLFMSHLANETNTYYRNDGGVFEDATAQSGLGPPSWAYTGFGLGFADFDHDGYQDVFIANGRVTRSPSAAVEADPYAEANLLFRGLVDGRRAQVASYAHGGRSLVKSSRGAAFGDLDNDGDIDIVVVNLGSSAHVFRNQAGNLGTWVMFRMLNREGVDAIGATIKAVAAGRAQWRTVQPAYSYCASNDPRVHFGLGSAKAVEEVMVHWPRGDVELFGPFEPGRLFELREGQGRRP